MPAFRAANKSVRNQSLGQKRCVHAGSTLGVGPKDSGRTYSGVWRQGQAIQRLDHQNPSAIPSAARSVPRLVTITIAGWLMAAMQQTALASSALLPPTLTVSCAETFIAPNRELTMLNRGSQAALNRSIVVPQ
jgi:hypothetical protein